MLATAEASLEPNDGFFGDTQDFNLKKVALLPERAIALCGSMKAFTSHRGRNVSSVL